MKVFLSTDMEGTAGVVAWEAILLTRSVAEAV